MSCCGGSCSCGPACGCGSGCGMYPDVEKATTTTAVIIEGVAPVMNTVSEGSAEKSSGAEGGHACNCTPKCTCNPCKC